MKTIESFKAPTILLICVSIIFLSGCDSSTTNPDPPFIQGPILLIGDQDDGAMSLIALESGAFIRDAAGLGINPNDIVEFEDLIYVINSGSDQLNVLRVLENNTLEHDTIISLRDSNPMQGAVANDGKMYISNLIAGTVTVYDTKNSQLLSNLFVGKSPDGVVITNGKVYVCNTGYDFDDRSYQPGSISTMLVGQGSFNVDDEISVGTNPQNLAVDPGGRLHVVCGGNNEDIKGRIYIINTDADTVEQVFDLGGGPIDIAITFDGYAYLTAGGWVDGEPGYVYRYNAATGEILNGPNNPIEVGAGAWNIVADEDGSVYVSCQNTNEVRKIVGDSVDNTYQVGGRPGPLLIYRR